MTINVLVVDNSALIRRLLSDIVQRTPGLTLAGTARMPMRTEQW